MTKEIDFERAMMLMSIMEKQANVSPMLTSISGEAAQELKGIAEDCRQNGAERADAIRKEEQVAEAQRLEAVRAHDEENAKPRGTIQPSGPQVYMPGEPDPNVRSEDVRPKGTSEDKNANGIADAQEQPVAETAPIVDRRV